MTAGLYNFVIEQNAKFNPVLTWKDSSGNLVNLTGWTATMKIWDVQTKNLLLTLTMTPDSNGNVITLGGTAGTISILIKTVTTETLNFSVARYMLRLNDTTSEGERIIEGSISFSPEGP
jgi:hypothetical protein